MDIKFEHKNYKAISYRKMVLILSTIVNILLFLLITFENSLMIWDMLLNPNKLVKAISLTVVVTFGVTVMAIRNTYYILCLMRNRILFIDKEIHIKTALHNYTFPESELRFYTISDDYHRYTGFPTIDMYLIGGGCITIRGVLWKNRIINEITNRIDLISKNNDFQPNDEEFTDIRDVRGLHKELHRLSILIMSVPIFIGCIMTITIIVNLLAISINNIN